MMIVVVATFLEPTFIIARGWLLAAWLISVSLICGCRFWLRRGVYALRSLGYFVAPTAIVGVNGEAVAIADQLKHWGGSGLDIVGFIDVGPSTVVSSMTLSPLLGSIADLEEIIRLNSIEEVIVATTAVPREQLLELFERLGSLPNVEMRLSSGLFEVITTGVEVQSLGFVPLMSLNRLRLEPAELAMKSALDYGLAFSALLVLSPVLAAIALTIKLDSPGPVFHRRRVLGVGGREFDAFKFRTMYVNGDAILAKRPDLLAELRTNHKLKDDPRLTKPGHWLRRYSLDELPQLVNVLLGQMSLVGPRMITASEGEKYGRLRRNLLTVKPGITGMWQVSGRSELTYEERVRLDMYFIRNYTIWRDLQILFIQTIPAVMRGRGAY
jgi:exopolysaccharide biosynthesis polyprenyl glycosylphosphotransferase